MIQTCQNGYCIEHNECVKSTFGILCSECSYRGYLINNTCQCYDGSTQFGCYRPIKPEFNLVNVVIPEKSIVTCIPFNDTDHGCYLINEGSLVPNKCCSDFIGPPIGELYNDDFEECNTYGYLDPNEPSLVSKFKTCSGHGVWDKIGYGCICNNEWTLVEVGESIYSCNACSGFWGPHPPLELPEDEIDTLYCSELHTPNENGELLPCSGHGEIVNKNCVCYQDNVNGYWQGTTITKSFPVYNYNNKTTTNQLFSVNVCDTCMFGAFGLNCLERDESIPLSNQFATSANPPQTSLCPSCIHYSNRGLVQIDIIRLNNTIESMFMKALNNTSPICCSIANSTVFESLVRVYKTTCPIYYLGGYFCSHIDNCVFFTSKYNIDLGYVDIQFTNSTNVVFISSPLYNAGKQCI
jgi:hypothetical protein